LAIADATVITSVIAIEIAFVCVEIASTVAGP
jgi:hypothetical protein